ncbi:MAG: D-glycerate dehydrogenase [bacterium]|nr:D-glycerate dehydrogenase [bacterium]
MKQKVFVSKGVPMEAIAHLKKEGYLVVQGKDVKKEGKGAHALLCMLTVKVDEKVMDAVGSQLKVVSNMATGLDNIDFAAAKKRGVSVANTPGVLTETVAEHAVALLLTLTRRIVEGDSFMRKKKYKGWDPELLLGVELKGKTLGVVGHGRIGCRTAEILQKGFDMSTLYYDIEGPDVHEVCGARKYSLQELLRKSDVVSIHVPLLATTRHLIGAKELQLMKKTAYLINTARGPIVDETALVTALQAGEIAGAGLDVFEKEPKMATGLSLLSNVVLTPHIASASREARGAMAQLAAQNIIAILKNV